MSIYGDLEHCGPEDLLRHQAAALIRIADALEALSMTRQGVTAMRVWAECWNNTPSDFERVQSGEVEHD